MYSQEFEKGFIVPFIDRLCGMQKPGGRAIALLAAPPAAGKSTLAARIEELSRSENGLPRVQALAMDGFHMKQSYLKSHTFLRNGTETPLSEIKGAPVTFDAEALLEKIKRLRNGEDICFPAYDRKIHDTVDDAVKVTAAAVIIEGNYMLLDRPVWRDLRKYADVTVFLRAEPEDLLDRLIQRKLSAGRTYEYAKAFAVNSDLSNARLILNESAPADIVLRTDAQGNMEVIR